MKKAIISAKGLCKSFAHNGGQVHILTGMDIDTDDLIGVPFHQFQGQFSTQSVADIAIPLILLHSLLQNK